MNNRQKAKRFKKLYEVGLSKIIFTRNLLKRYRCNVEIPEENREEAIHIMAKHFEQLASEHIEYNKQLGQYELTLWVKGKLE